METMFMQKFEDQTKGIMVFLKVGNCAVVARAPNTTARDQCMIKLKIGVIFSTSSRQLD